MSVLKGTLTPSWGVGNSVAETEALVRNPWQHLEACLLVSTLRELHIAVLHREAALCSPALAPTHSPGRRRGVGDDA